MKIKDLYHHPRMDECINTLGDARIFTAPIELNGYFQIYIPKEDREKTSFVCQTGQFRYTHMPIDLTNTTATFHRVLDVIPSRFKCKTCLVYIENIITFSKSVEEHIQHRHETLTALGDAGATLKVMKCNSSSIPFNTLVISLKLEGFKSTARTQGNYAIRNHQGQKQICDPSWDCATYTDD